MKRIMAIAVALILCFSLAACGGKDKSGGDKGDTSPAQGQSTQGSAQEQPKDGNAASQADNAPAPAPAPEPEPKGETVSITSGDYGDIVFTAPVGAAVDVAGQGTESLEVLTKESYDKDFFRMPDTVQYQKAHVKVDDVNMVFGYTDFSNELMKSFESFRYYHKGRGLEDVSYGGLDGFICVEGALLMFFPAITQYAARTIAVYPDIQPEKHTRTALGEWSKLLELPWVADLLGSMKFEGATLNEPRWETQPVDNSVYKLTPVDGWEVTRTQRDNCELRKEGTSDWSVATENSAEIRIYVWSLNTPTAQVETIIKNSFNKEAKQEGNMTINGREYMVVHMPKEKTNNTTYWLVTSSGAYNVNEKGALYIEVVYTDDLDAVMKQLEAIEFKK